MGLIWSVPVSYGQTGGGERVMRGEGGWAREIGAICPFGVFFSQFESTFWPNLGAILFRPEYGLFKLPKHVLKGEWPILNEKYYNWGRNAKRTNGTHFTRVQEGGGGSKTIFGEGFYGMFSHTLSFPPPFAAL